MDKITSVDYHITQTKYPIYRISEWDKYQQYKKTSKRYVRQMPWFKFHARELVHQSRFMTLYADKFRFLVLLMCYASLDDGYLVFEELLYQFRGDLDEDKLKNNLEFLENKRFINQVNSAEFIDSRSYGWHRNNTNESISDNRRYKGNEIGDAIGDLINKNSLKKVQFLYWTILNHELL